MVLLGVGSIERWFFGRIFYWEMVLLLEKWFYLLGDILGDGFIPCNIVSMGDGSIDASTESNRIF